MLIRFASSLLAACLALMTTAAAANEAPVEQSLSRCAKRSYTPEALRYRLEGTTTISFVRSSLGKPLRPVVSKSSGWGKLDEDAMRLLATCTFATPPNDLPDAAFIVVPWKLPAGTPNPAPPAIIASSCPARSPVRIAAPGTPGAIPVRLMVWTDGQVYQPKFDAAHVGDATRWTLLDFLHGCRFTPARQGSEAVPGTTVIHVELTS